MMRSGGPRLAAAAVLRCGRRDAQLPQSSRRAARRAGRAQQGDPPTRTAAWRPAFRADDPERRPDDRGRALPRSGATDAFQRGAGVRGRPRCIRRDRRAARIGASPIARLTVTPLLQAAWTHARPGIAVHVIETATGPLLRAVGSGELDMAVAGCAPREPGLRYERLRDEPVMAHVAIDHPLARETAVTLARLAEETILVGGGDASRGYTEGIETLFAAAGLSPNTLPDPYPDLGLLAAIEGRAVVLGSPVQAVRERPDLAILEIAPQLTLPFDLVWRDRALPATLAAIIDIARTLRDRSGWLFSAGE